MTTVRLQDDILYKLEELVTFEQTTKSEVIKKALIEYYDRHIGSLSSYEAGESLFGNYGGDEDLSSTYKERLKAKLDEKHAH